MPSSWALKRTQSTAYIHVSHGRSIDNLTQHLTKISTEYEKINEEMATGETSGFDAAWLAQISLLLTSDFSTLHDTRAKPQTCCQQFLQESRCWASAWLCMTSMLYYTGLDSL